MMNDEWKNIVPSRFLAPKRFSWDGDFLQVRLRRGLSEMTGPPWVRFRLKTHDGLNTPIPFIIEHWAFSISILLKLTLEKCESIVKRKM